MIPPPMSAGARVDRASPALTAGDHVPVSGSPFVEALESRRTHLLRAARSSDAPDEVRGLTATHTRLSVLADAFRRPPGM